VTEVEKTYGGGTGSLKLATVIETIYPKLTVLVRMFINVSVLEKWVDTVLAEAKKTWESNSSIAAYIKESEKPTTE
ncbi:MAG: hypothetical protein GX851_06705, partial [Clostridiales bacterium]|nr:hypothetical protein [Clostridiales bacterium]